MSIPGRLQAASGLEGPARTDTLRSECLAIVRHIDTLRRYRRAGPLAELRRLERVGDGGPPPEAFWSLITAARITDVQREAFWEAVVPMMVTCAHTPTARPGRALRRAGVSSARLERWLRLSADSARRELRKLLRRIDGVDWVRLAHLLWHWDHPVQGDALRRAFARDFFLSEPPAAAPTTTPTSTPA
jgi:CRISPR type I-E-associated protein CasB/Cse2